MNIALTLANPRDPNLHGSFLLAMRLSRSTLFTTITRKQPRQPSEDMLDHILNKAPDVLDNPEDVILARVPEYGNLPPLTAIIAAKIGNRLSAALDGAPIRPIDNDIPVIRCHRYVGRFADGEDAVLLYQTAFSSGISTFATINPIDGRAYDLTPDQNIRTFRGVLLPDN